jgi:membrane-bound lytic murein transglycosylase D
MKFKIIVVHIIIACSVHILNPANCYAHEITFCGEKIPVTNEFVAQKLMNVIKRQVPEVNLPQLRKRAAANFPIVEYYLRGTNLPEDFKYLAIVESGFVGNAVSSAGAGGFWQLMPNTAKELGLTVNETIDERNDIQKSTLAACRVLAQYYLAIRKKYKISSWALTAAAYNFGIGSIFNNIDKQGKDYFSMKLNPETAVYVYKIIAVKELFEYPELYMKNFSYNVFNSSAKPAAKVKDDTNVDLSEFSSMTVKVSENDGQHPEDVEVKDLGSVVKPLKSSTASSANYAKVKLVAANIKGKYKNFEDGKPISIQLQEDLQVRNRFTRAGNVLKGVGWIINDRVYVDLGFEGHDVILYDSNSKQGIEVSSLKNDEPLLLKVQYNDD